MTTMRVLYILLIFTGIYFTVQALIDARWVYRDHVLYRRNGNRQMFAAKAVRQEWLMLSIFFAMLASACIGFLLPDDRFRDEFVREYGLWLVTSLGLQMFVTVALILKVLMRRYDRRLLLNMLESEFVDRPLG